jgi:phage terminase large subunit-like protein
MFEPTYCTQPLSEDFASAIDDYFPALEAAWRKAFGYWLDDWQVELLRRSFEVYPADHAKAGVLRFRQIVCSLSRQNGKTEIAAAASLFWLLWRQRNEFMVGMAANALQAKIIYDRVKKVIEGNPKSIGARMSKMTDTRGIQTKQGTNYVILANRESSTQGFSVGLGLLDELHTYKNESVYAAVLSGTGSRDNSQIFGITTAGDENSQLLKDLYAQGLASLEDPNTRFGFFCWQAAEDRVPEDDEELLTLLRQANPALASGRIDEGNLITDVRAMPHHDIIRYRLNRFTQSQDTFIDLGIWGKCARGRNSVFPRDADGLIFAIDRTIDLGFASVVAAVMDKQGVVHTELVASLRKPSLEQLVNLCVTLRKHKPVQFILDNYNMKDLVVELKKRGIPFEAATHSDVINASVTFEQRILTRKLSHDGGDLMTMQLPNARKKMVSGSDVWKIARKPGTDIDAVYAHALAVHFAEPAALGAGKLQLF